jgi:ketopantoate reductase
MESFVYNYIFSRLEHCPFLFGLEQTNLSGSYSTLQVNFTSAYNKKMRTSGLSTHEDNVVIVHKKQTQDTNVPSKINKTCTCMTQVIINRFK